LTYTQRSGPSQNNRYQRTLYALGAINAGLLDGDQTVWVGNVYWDRSGAEKRPLVFIEELDLTQVNEIDEWVRDVIYAVEHNEPAAQDIPAAVCEQICEWFTLCRGGVLPDSDNPALIEDETTLNAVAMYVEGRNMATEGDKLKKAASAQLVGANGLANINGTNFQVRWTQIAGRDGYFVKPSEPTMRIDVRKARTPK
jgi:hypothetical protein